MYSGDGIARKDNRKEQIKWRCLKNLTWRTGKEKTRRKKLRKWGN